MVIEFTTCVVVLIAAVQVAWAPPAQSTPPLGDRYSFRLLGAPIVHVGALV
jgi:hypothetical protein